MAATRSTRKPRSPVLNLTSHVPALALDEVERRLHVVRGLLDAFEHIDDVNRAIRSATDRLAALSALQGDPLRYSPEQATAILDMPMSWQCAEAVGHLRDEKDSLSAHRADVHERTTESLSLHWFG